MPVKPSQVKPAYLYEKAHMTLYTEPQVSQTCSDPEPDIQENLQKKKATKELDSSFLWSIVK